MTYRFSSEQLHFLSLNELRGLYAQKARVMDDWLVPLPDGLSTKQAMAVGTAGFTAMRAVMALEDHGLTPDQGEVLLTGAAGAVSPIFSVGVSLRFSAKQSGHDTTHHALENGHKTVSGAFFPASRRAVERRRPFVRIPLNREVMRLRIAGQGAFVAGDRTLIRAKKERDHVSERRK